MATNWSEYVYISDHKADVIAANSFGPYTLDGTKTIAFLCYNSGFNIPGYMKGKHFVAISNEPLDGVIPRTNHFAIYTLYGIFYGAAPTTGAIPPFTVNGQNVISKVLDTADDIVSKPDYDLFEYLAPILKPSKNYVPIAPYSMMMQTYNDGKYCVLYGLQGFGHKTRFFTDIPNVYGSAQIIVNSAINKRIVFAVGKHPTENKVRLLMYSKEQLESGAVFQTKVNDLYIYANDYFNFGTNGNGVYAKMVDHNGDNVFVYPTLLPLSRAIEESKTITSGDFLDIVSMIIDYGGTTPTDYMDLNTPGNSVVPGVQYQFVNPVPGLIYDKPMQINIRLGAAAGATKNPYCVKELIFEVPKNVRAAVFFDGKEIVFRSTSPGTKVMWNVYNNGDVIASGGSVQSKPDIVVPDIFDFSTFPKPEGPNMTWLVKIRTPFIFLRQIYNCASRDQLPQPGSPTYEIWQPGTDSIYVDPSGVGEKAAAHLLSFNSLYDMKAAADKTNGGT